MSRDSQTEASSLCHDASKFGELALCRIARKVQADYNTIASLSPEQLNAQACETVANGSDLNKNAF
jgi:hypothetical protein